MPTRPQAVRSKLPDERTAITHKFDIGGHEGYITVGLYEDGMPGELFLVMAKEGSTISGFADAFALAVSYCLQYGVPLSVLVDKFSHMRFEPSGMTRDPHVRFAKSIVDYVFRWMAARFPSVAGEAVQQDAPPCSNCGAIMVPLASAVMRTGFQCPNCNHLVWPNNKT